MRWWIVSGWAVFGRSFSFSVRVELLLIAFVDRLRVRGGLVLGAHGNIGVAGYSSVFAPRKPSSLFDRLYPNEGTNSARIKGEALVASIVRKILVQGL
ncbi:hypothetical protein R1flu_018146 [Riccia fluitans]|uniref:Secreted protein n=1 Tax=Riccia fluitans TaxID=41844 RepID=A0ABD1ZF03_9MARC